MRRLAAILVMVAALPASASAYGPLQPPLSLPETLRGIVQVPLQGMAGGGRPVGGKPIDTLRDLFPALAACWQAPEGLAKFEHTEITVRFSLRRDGSVIGSPRITFSQTPVDARGKALLIEASLSAVRRCTPARITPALGGAIAGRPLALRFVYEGPKGRGV